MSAADAKRTTAASRAAAVAAAVATAVGAWLYYRYVWVAAPSMIWIHAGTEYRFLSPRMLGVVLLAPYIVWIMGRSLADLPLSQRWASVLLRVAFVLVLAAGLARLARTTTSRRVCTVVLVDVSDSVSDAAVEDERRTVAALLAAKPPDDRMKVVTFSERPRLTMSDDENADVARAVARHGRGYDAGTDVAAALQLAYGLFPDGYVRHVVLVTDGVETEGDLLAEARRAKEFGVEVSVVPVRKGVPGEVAVRELRLPEHLREQEPFDVHARVFSSVHQTVKLSLKQGDVINGLDGIKTVVLDPGDNDIAFKSRAAVPGDVTYALEVLESESDHFVENNRATASATVLGRPVVLYVDGTPERSYLPAALSAQQLNVDTIDPLPTTLREAEKYDFIILSDVSADRVSLAQQQVIEEYVRDLGGGFLFAGGENGYGLGGWQHSAIERILPVRMDPDKRRDEPDVAMALVIDRSGSMTGLPLEMAKQAAKATADTLAADDLLEVIAFDSQPTRIVQMTAARHGARIQTDIARIQAGGGTEIFPALDAAYQALSSARAKRKHAILLTDGQAPNTGIRDLVQAMAAEDITVTTVGLGAGADEGLLRMIAEVGGGRFYRVADPQSLPRIFTRETEMVSRSAAVEEYFQPRVASPADFLRGIDVAGAPLLHGYVATRMKESPAQEILASELDEPILARWHVGLGWTLAWTSDVKSRWAVEWLRWRDWGAFWGQLVREHMRLKKHQVFDMNAAIDPATGYVHAALDAVGLDDRFQNGLDASLTVTGPEPEGATREVPMTQTAPGRYEADFPLSKYGSFLLHAVLSKSVDDTKGKRVPVAESFGHVSSSYPREYLALSADVTTLARIAEATGGEVDPAPAAAFDPRAQMVRYNEDLWPRLIGAGIAVFLLDLLVRRVRLLDRKANAMNPGLGRARNVG